MNKRRNDKARTFKSNKKNMTGNTRSKSYSKSGQARGAAPKVSVDSDFVEENRIEGRNSVLEALKSGKAIDKIYIRKGYDGSLKVIAAMASEKGIAVIEADKMKLDQMSVTEANQGVVAICPAHEYVEVDDILQNAKNKNEEPFIIILDEIEDPHNLGAIIRSADAAGAHGIIIPKRRSVGLTAVVSKTSAGAVEYVPVARVTNISNTIESLKKEGLWIACASAEGEECFKAKLTGAIAVVIGSEGTGVSRLVKEKSDFTIRIPMYGNVSSLNASVAAGVVMYEIVRQRKFCES